MKIHYIILILFFNITTSFSQAQEDGLLTGEITDKNNNKLFGASVRVTENGNYITGAGAIEGRYNIALAPGIYDVEAIYFGLLTVKAPKIEIKPGEVTKLDFQLIAKARFDIETVFDTVHVKAIEIDSLNIRFGAMLDNHIKETKRFNKNESCIVVRIGIANVHYIDKNKLDSICNLFVKDNFGSSIGYNIQISTIRNNNVYVYGITNWEKTYYYKYKGWSVIFLTTLNIDFQNSGKIKKLEFDLKYKDYVEKENGKYRIGEIDETKVKKTKRYEWNGSSYNLFDHAVEQSKCKTKTLYSPFR